MAGRSKINGITIRQEKFCQCVASGTDQSAAYRASYSCANMKPETIRQRAYDLMKNPQISERINEIASPAIEKAVEVARVTRERITIEMACRAFYDPADFIKVKKPDDIAKLPEDVRRSICGWGYDKFGNFILKLADKDRSLRNLGETMAMFTNNVNNHNSDAPDYSNVDDDTLTKMLAEAAK